MKDFSSFTEKLKKNEGMELIIHIKITYIDTFLQNYILYNFSNVFNDVKLKTLSKRNVIALLRNNFLIKENQNNFAVFIGIWLLEEKNLSEDPSDIINLVRWNLVSIEVLFEFIIKFASLIEKCKFEDFFSKTLKQLLEENNSNGNYCLN